MMDLRPMENKIKVDEWKGEPIYLDKSSSQFFCNYAGLEYRDTNLANLKLDLQKSTVKPLKGKAFTKSYNGIVLIELIRQWEGYQGEGTRITYRELEGVSSREDSADESEIYPYTEHNRKMYEEGKRLKDEGWTLIRKGERYATQLRK
jgi:hypothetical protein